MRLEQSGLYCGANCALLRHNLCDIVVQSAPFCSTVGVGVVGQSLWDVAPLASFRQADGAPLPHDSLGLDNRFAAHKVFEWDSLEGHVGYTALIKDAHRLAINHRQARLAPAIVVVEQHLV